MQIIKAALSWKLSYIKSEARIYDLYPLSNCDDSLIQRQCDNIFLSATHCCHNIMYIFPVH